MHNYDLSFRCSAKKFGPQQRSPHKRDAGSSATRFDGTVLKPGFRSDYMVVVEPAMKSNDLGRVKVLNEFVRL